MLAPTVGQACPRESTAVTLADTRGDDEDDEPRLVSVGAPSQSDLDEGLTDAEKMERVMGIEPTTFSLGIAESCSGSFRAFEEGAVVSC